MTDKSFQINEQIPHCQKTVICFLQLHTLTTNHRKKDILSPTTSDDCHKIELWLQQASKGFYT